MIVIHLSRIDANKWDVYESCKYKNSMTCTIYIARLTAQCCSAPPELCEQCVCVCMRALNMELEPSN